MYLSVKCSKPVRSDMLCVVLCRWHVVSNPTILGNKYLYSPPWDNFNINFTKTEHSPHVPGLFDILTSVFFKFRINANLNSIHLVETIYYTRDFLDNQRFFHWKFFTNYDFDVQINIAVIFKNITCPYHIDINFPNNISMEIEFVSINGNNAVQLTKPQKCAQGVYSLLQ